METKFSARQKLLGMSDCERLSGRTSRDVSNLAWQAGWRGVPSDPITLTVGSALNLLILSDAMNYGVELSSMAPWLPGLRNEALFTLGEALSNWSFHGPSGQEQQFWSMLYGNRHAVRPRIARLLGCFATDVTTRRLRYHSQADVECVSNTQFQLGRYDDRVPWFMIDAHDLAERVQATSGTPLFTVRVAVLA